MKKVKNVQGLDQVQIQEALVGVAVFNPAAVPMKACHANRTVTGSGNVVLRNVKAMSSKERVDPRVVELRAILLC